MLLDTRVFDKVINQAVSIIYKNTLSDLKYRDENCEVYEIQFGSLHNVPFMRRLSLKRNRSVA